MWEIILHCLYNVLSCFFLCSFVSQGGRTCLRARKANPNHYQTCDTISPLFHCTCTSECLQTYHAEWFGGEDFSTVHARVSAYKRTVPTGPVMRIAPLPIAGCGRACLRTSDQAPPAAAGTCLIQTMQVYSFRPCVLIQTMQVYSFRPCVLIQTMQVYSLRPCVLIQTIQVYPIRPCMLIQTMQEYSLRPCMLIQTMQVYPTRPCVLIQTSVLIQIQLDKDCMQHACGTSLSWIGSETRYTQHACGTSLS